MSMGLPGGGGPGGHGHLRLPHQQPGEIHALRENTPCEKGKEVFLAAPGAEAIYLSCLLWHGASDTIEKLEAEFAVPVLTQFNPILHKALNALGCSGPVERIGRLLGGGKSQ